MAGVPTSEVVCLDAASDRPVGPMDKLAAHREGAYHAAISVLLWTSSGEHVVQRRAAGKYHSPMLWANACCSHPYPGEAPADAAHRRLHEELGVQCRLDYMGVVRYRAQVPCQHDGMLIEHEHVSLFGGVLDAPLAPDPAEVDRVERHTTGALTQGAFKLAPWFGLYLTLFDTAPAAPRDHGFHDLG
jgi:isopentenyl-diphosphate delta-isomerase